MARTPHSYDNREPEDSRSPSGKRIWLYLLLAGLGVMLLWLAFKGLQISQAASSLLSLQDNLQQIAANGLMSADPAQIESLATQARADVVTLRNELAPLMPLAPRLGWVPGVGPLLKASPALLDMADAGSEAGVLVLRGVGPALSVAMADDFGLARLGEVLPVFETAEPDLDAAAAALERYQTARAELEQSVPLEELPWRVQQLLQAADENLPLAQDGLELLPLLPSLLGADEPRRYLIMAQNEDELRPTGGFLTGAGLVTLDGGRIIDLRFSDTYQVDNYEAKPYDFPPQPLYDFMLAEMFLFRDANFWADFPTSADKAMALYAYGQDVPPVDGAIAIDQEFLRQLVEVVGPIPVEGGGEAITGDNLIRTLRSARDPEEGQDINEWVNNRKGFLSGFAAAIQSKLENDFSSIDPVYLGRQMLGALDSRHLQIYIPEGETAAVLNRLGWDGRLPETPPGDMWSVIDTNVGFNKANVFVERTMTYEIDLSAPEKPLAMLTVSYNHTGEPLDEPCYQGVATEFEEGESYLAIANKCYWNYLRIYAPVGSTLIDSSRSVVPGETMFTGKDWDSAAAPINELSRAATFANLILVPQAGSAEAYFRYTLPTGVVAREGDATVYNLHIQKQAGTRPEAVSVTVTLPSGATLLSATPEPTADSGGQLRFDLTLKTNQTLTVVYR